MSFRTRLFYIFLLFGLLLAVAAELLMMKINTEVVEKDSLKKAALYAKDLKANFKHDIYNAKTELQAVRESKIFQRNFTQHRVTECSKSLFLDMAKASSFIMQLRYIDKKGNEVIRVERNNPAQEVFLRDAKQLQNKANRYYFKAIMKLHDGEYWYSKLDLNVEHSKIEKPLKPVLRIGTPYYYQGKKEGILIINIFMQSFLDTLVSSNIYNIYLLDKENYNLVNTQHINEWSRYLNNNSTAKSDKVFVYDKHTYSLEELHLGNHEGLKLLVIPNQHYIESQVKENFYQFFWVVLAVLLLSFPLSYFMSLIPTKLKSEVDTLNEQLQKEAKERDVLLSLFDYSDAVLFKWNNDEDWSVSFVSQSVKNLLGYEQSEFASNSISYVSCIHHDDLERVQKELEEAIAKKVYFFVHEPYRVVTKNKKIKWILDNTVIVRNEADEIVNFVGYLTDITEIKAKEFELKNLARIDQLTKINNRLYLDELLTHQYYRFNRYSEECSLILIDIDHFKEVNDKYGHLAGDRVLIEFAELLQKSIRKNDIVGRWGGEEFLIILPHTYIDKAAFLAEKLCKIVAEHHFSIVEHKTASFGVATFEHGLTIEQCVDMADSALYEAKKAGRNMVKVAKQKQS